MLGNFLIGLREGVEAALIISILLTYLSRTGRESLRTHVWRGIALATAMSAAIAVGLERLSADASDRVEPIFSGAISLVAVGFVTWMIFWMKQAAPTIASDLRGRLDDAALAGSGIAVSGMAFVAVAREGAETAVFFFAAARAAGQQGASIVGLALGLAGAAAIGWLFYRSSVRVNLQRLFAVTGILLVFVAAGVLSYAVAEFQEVGLLPGAHAIALDLSHWLPEGSTASTFAAGVFNIGATTTYLQVAAWLAFTIPVLILVRRPAAAPTTTPAPSPQLTRR